MNGINPNPVKSSLQPHVVFVTHQIANVPIIGRRCTQVAIVNKQPSHVRPKTTDVRSVGIRLVIGMLMVHSVNQHPASGRILKTAYTQGRKRVLKPFWTIKPSMS